MENVFSNSRVLFLGQSLRQELRCGVKDSVSGWPGQFLDRTAKKKKKAEQKCHGAI